MEINVDYPVTLTYFEKESTAEIGNSLQINLVHFGSKAQAAKALVKVRG
jgi:hypothetical protein